MGQTHCSSFQLSVKWSILSQRSSDFSELLQERIKRLSWLVKVAPRKTFCGLVSITLCAWRMSTTFATKLYKSREKVAVLAPNSPIDMFNFYVSVRGSLIIRRLIRVYKQFCFAHITLTLSWLTKIVLERKMQSRVEWYSRQALEVIN